MTYKPERDAPPIHIPDNVLEVSEGHGFDQLIYNLSRALPDKPEDMDDYASMCFADARPRTNGDAQRKSEEEYKDDVEDKPLSGNLNGLVHGDIPDEKQRLED